MKKFLLASCAAILVLAPVLALAQSRTPPSGSTTVGSASPRGGESGSSSSGSNAGSTSSAGSSMGSFGAVGGSGGMSSPVASAGARNYSGPRSGESVPSARARSAGDNVGQAVPASERPRGDRPMYGTAAVRGTVPSNQTVIINNGGLPWGYFDPYYGYNGYYGYGYYGYGSYGFDMPGFGFMGYSPYWSAMYGWNPALYGTYGYWSDYYGVGATYSEMASAGSVRLKVNPKDGEVYVDGTYFGHVDDYNGTFQHLDLRSGTHRLEIRATGYEPITVELRVLPGKTITYSGNLKPAQK